MASTTLSVPEIHCGHCKSAIEGAVGPIDGVRTVEVDVDTRSVRVEHDDAMTVHALVDVIEDQGYDVPDQEALAG
ncbi:copper chaperone CopZ [Actinomycetospora sp. NBRC 106375]|uniref:copper ion binding protein n=1 Tax=Actinomycetospora sp. NBRC 106375 TaxID=3032207 RepID=UPI0024A2FD7E|nr:copper ion binding protein [Actinomycetospora sp. NBRC 106375]GLZ46676.1 copper chaperone CopZ [Actinomycetospora sp. NBRC 106375]